MRTARKIISAVLVLATVFSMCGVFAGTVSATESTRFIATVENNPGLSFDVNAYHESDGYHVLLPEGIIGDIIVLKTNFPQITSYENCNIDIENGLITCEKKNGAIVVNGNNVYIKIGSVASMNITVASADELDWIHRDKEAKISTSVVINDPENDKYDLTAENVELKTRGNSTWAYDKKPYQIKFESKVNLFGMGKAKKWVLLANYLDGSMMRNKVIFDIGESFGMPYTCKSVFVDLYINGFYRGVYQLCEKVEAGSNRVELADDFGVLLEMECNPRLTAEDINFITETTGKAFVYKDYVTDFEDTENPEVIAKTNEVKQYVEGYINDLEAKMYNKDTEWAEIEKMIDVKSFIDYYFITELSEEVDATFASTYFYMDGKDDVLHCGPLWDYDRCLGMYAGYTNNPTEDFLKNITKTTDDYRVEWFKQLFRYPEFVKAVNDYYTDVVQKAANADIITAKMDVYAEMLRPSLLMDHDLWPVFYDIDTLASEKTGSGTRGQVGLVTKDMKTWVKNRFAYLDTAYGTDIPTLTFSIYGTYQSFKNRYSSGCMANSSNVYGISAQLSDTEVDGGIEYATITNGERSATGRDGEIVDGGDTTKAKGVYFKLYGNMENYYTLQYRVLEGGEWTEWISDGECAGTTGRESVNITSIQLRILKKADFKYGTISVVGKKHQNFDDIEVIAGNTWKAEAPAVKGYNFDGWYSDASFEGEPLTSLEIAEGTNTVVYAKFTPKTTKAGDVNGDNRLNANDKSLLQKFLSGINDNNFVAENADFNGDARLNSRDTLAFSRYLAGK